jgi:ABC-type phosphate transport system substrate-binding protein
MRRVAVILCLVVLPALILAADSYTVVVNLDNAQTSIGKSTLRRIYLGQMSKLNGTKVVPINLPLDSDVARKFLKEVVGKTPQQYKEYWVAQQIKGAGTAPMIQKTAKAVTSTVSQVPGAIGYVPTGTAGKDVKSIPVK